MNDCREATKESFKETAEAFAVQRGKLWVSQINFPDSGMYEARVRGRSLLIFAGVDHLELSVADARALRDWLTSILPEATHAATATAAES